MSQDIRMFCACTHLVDEELYDVDSCPRCYGKGYYFDVTFDGGKAVLSEGSIKLEQELLKILIEEKGSNVFHLDWGNEITRLVGTKNTSIKRSKIEVLVKQTLDHLKAVQHGEDAVWGNMMEEEKLGEILSIDVVETSGRDGYIIKVKISNTSGDTIVQTFNL